MAEYQNPMQERELGWDDTIEHDSEFVLLPAGEYDFTVKSVERGRYTPGPNAKLPPCNMATLVLNCTDGAQSADVRERLYLHSRCEGRLCAFFAAIGHRRHGEPLKMNWAAVPGATGRLKLGVREWTNRDSGEKMQGNEVKSYCEYEPKPVTGYTPGQF